MFFPFIPLISGRVEAAHEFWLKALLGLRFMQWNNTKSMRNTESTADNLGRKARQLMNE